MPIQREMTILLKANKRLFVLYSGKLLSVVGPCPEIFHETKLKVRITWQETLLDSTAFRLSIAGCFHQI